MKKGAKIGIAAGITASIILAVGLVLFLRKKDKEEEKPQPVAQTQVEAPSE